MSKNRTGTFIGGVVLGTALGTVAGLLFAPRSGRETRKLLKKSADAIPELAEDLSTSVQLQADRLSETAKNRWEQTLNRLKEAVAAGIEASNLERENKFQTPVSSVSPPNSDIKTPPHLLKNSIADTNDL
ncbi:MAG TPA: YtxH domain-containing protein [Halomicronema sp.]